MIKFNEKFNKFSLNLPDYLLLAVALGTIYSALVYYFYALNWGSIIFILILIILSFFTLNKHLFKNSDVSENITNIKEKNDKNYLHYWPYLIYFVLFVINLYLLYKSRSDRSLISPWQIINYKFFIFYSFSSLTLTLILAKKEITTASKLIALSFHYFLSFSIVALIYKIGYGFDPFIHGATMELIDKSGSVTPKPFYYLGEYGLIILLHKLSGFSIYILNKFLLIILAAIFLPISIYRFINSNNSNFINYLTPLFILILGFSPFIVTTPQNLSYLFLILTIIFGLTKNNTLWSLILALATLAVHPLTGIPALCWWLALNLINKKDKIKQKTYKALKYFLFAGSVLILPLALFISGGKGLKEINWNLNFLVEPIKKLFTTLSGAGQENWLLNFIYFFSYNYALWLIIIIGLSLFWFYRQATKPNFKSLIFINTALIAAYLISSQIVFTDLINYEQANFASRLLILIIIFFIPLITDGLNNFLNLIIKQNKLIKILWLIFGVTLITTSLYISYPRFDKYFNSRGYSTSQNDIAAVRLINQKANGRYLVLANQQVSAAALKEFGFDHYYQTSAGLIYFYPIPTGGQLYQYYLDMVYKNPSRETMAQARNLAGVDESYLVVNLYWFQSARVINAAKLTANSWENINNEIYIFKYLP